MTSFFGPVIYAYTRADALRDGELVDVSTMAAEMGYRVPVAVTRAVWVGVVEPDETPGQSVEGRLWDVLWMLHYAITTGPHRGSTIRFQLYALIGGVSRLLTLKAVMGPGDEAEPVLTIMWPDEDCLFGAHGGRPRSREAGHPHRAGAASPAREKGAARAVTIRAIGDRSPTSPAPPAGLRPARWPGTPSRPRPSGRGYHHPRESAPSGEGEAERSEMRGWALPPPRVPASSGAKASRQSSRRAGDGALPLDYRGS